MHEPWHIQHVIFTEHLRQLIETLIPKQNISPTILKFIVNLSHAHRVHAFAISHVTQLSCHFHAACKVNLNMFYCYMTHCQIINLNENLVKFARLNKQLFVIFVINLFSYVNFTWNINAPEYPDPGYGVITLRCKFRKYLERFCVFIYEK